MIIGCILVCFGYSFGIHNVFLEKYERTGRKIYIVFFWYTNYYLRNCYCLFYSSVLRQFFIAETGQARDNGWNLFFTSCHNHFYVLYRRNLYQTIRFLAGLQTYWQSPYRFMHCFFSCFGAWKRDRNLFSLCLDQLLFNSFYTPSRSHKPPNYSAQQESYSK